MKITLSKSQWANIGKVAGWMDEDNLESDSAERSLVANEETLAEEEAPSLKTRMMDFLRQSYGTEEGFEHDAEAAIYWFANDWHSGQTSELYSILSTSPFRPGPISTLESEGELVKMMYEDLEAKFSRET